MVMSRLYSDFSGGIDKNGFKAPENSLYDLKSFRYRGGSLVAGFADVQLTIDPIKIQGTYISGGGTAPVCYGLGASRGHVLVKLGGWVFAVNRYSGNNVRLHPLIYRTGGGTEHEVFRGADEDVLISPTEGSQYALRWGGCASMGTMLYNSEVTEGGKTYDVYGLTSVLTGLYGLYTAQSPLRWVIWYGTAGAGGLIDWAGQSYIDGWFAEMDFVRFECPSGVHTYDRFCIVDVSRLGVSPTAPTAPAVALVTDGTGSLTPGTSYKYAFRHVISSRGTAGMISAESATVVADAAHTKVNITIPDAKSLPMGPDQCEIYRSELDGTSWTPYQLVKIVSYEVSAAGWTTHRLTGAVTDDGTTVGDPLPGDAYWNSAPSYLRDVRLYNGRLWGVDPAFPNTLRFSTMGNYDQWPTEIVDVTDATSATLWAGGTIRLGSSSAITGMVPEGGDFGKTGTVGDNLLVMKKNSAYRLYGINWDDFRMTELPPVGTRASRSMVNCGIGTMFAGPNGIYAISQGSSEATEVSTPIWPTGMGWAAWGDTTSWSACHWYGNYVFSHREAGDFCFDTQTRTWWSLADGSPTRAQSYFANVDNAQFTESLLRVQGGVFTLCQNATTGTHTCHFETREDLFNDGPNDFARTKRLIRVSMGITNTSAATPQLALKFRADGYRAADVYALTFNIPYSATQPLQVVQVPIPPDEQVLFRSLSMKGELAYKNGIRIEWILLEYEPVALNMEPVTGITWTGSA